MKRNRWLILALSSSTVLSALGVGMSAAWYVSASQLYIETIELTVGGKQDLKVSLSSDLDSFASHTTGYEKDDEGNIVKKGEDTSLSLNEDSALVFKPVSSMYSFHEKWYDSQNMETWMDRKEEKPQFYDSYVNMHSKIPNMPILAKSGFFTTDIYFLATSDCYVTLDPYTSFFNGYRCVDEDGISFIPQISREIHKTNSDMAKKIFPYDSTFSLSESEYYEERASKMDNLYKAMRISFLDPDEDSYSYQIVDPFKEGETLFAGPLNLSPSDNYYDYYVDTDGSRKETIFGDVDESTRDKAVYSSPKERNDDKSVKINAADGSVFDADTQENTYHVEMDKSLENGLTVAKEHSYALKDQGGHESQLLIPVHRNQVKKVTLSIYLEGWDKDCINNTMGAKFLSTLSFQIAKEM